MLFENQLRDFYAMLPWVSTRNAKEKVRALDSQKRRILTPETIQEESAKVVARIEEMQHFQKAKVVMIYFPVHNEVDLRALVRKYADQKTFVFPGLTHRTHRMQVRKYEHKVPFTKGVYGIPEPQTEVYEGPIDLILVPGMSFDKHRWRVGRGGGYYDRFLRRYKGVYRIGVGYDFQLHTSVPHWWNDRRMNHVVTPSQTI